MKAIQKQRPAPGFALAEVPIPSFCDHEIRIHVRQASICGTDVHITEWDDWSASRIKPPMIYGHEFCGVVDAVGKGVTHVQPGDWVSAEMHIPCGTCRSCMIGKRHICNHLKIAGIDCDGCFAEYIVLPKEQVIRMPEGISPAYGACLDSLGNAVHAVAKGNVSGKSVLVSGCGPIGLFSIAVAKALGASRVYGTDIRSYRLNLASQMGADQVFDASEGNPTERIQAATHGSGPEVVLEMSGNPHALRQGFEALARGGTMVLLGIPHGPVELDVTNAIIFKEATVLGINGREMFQTWLLMLELLETGRLILDPVITHHLPLEAFGDAMKLVASGQSGKVILTPP